MDRLSANFQEMMHLKAVLEHGSINKAAAHVGVTQSALSRAIARLEASLGMKLLNRNARGVFPTSSGQALLDHIRIIDGELARTKSTLDHIRGGVGGDIRIGGSIDVVGRLFAPAILELRRIKPALRVRVSEGLPIDLLADLRRGELDVVVCGKSDDLIEPELHGEAIAASSVGLFVGAESVFLERAGLALDEIAKSAHWVLPNWSGPFYAQIHEEFEKSRLSMPLTAIETSSIALLKEILRNDPRAIAISTLNAIGEETPAVRPLQGCWHFPPIVTSVYLRASRDQSLAVLRFIELLKRSCAPNGETPKVGEENG